MAAVRIILDKPVIWMIDELQLSNEFLVSIAHLIPKKNMDDFWRVYRTNRNTSFQRHAHQYHDPQDMKSEDVIVDALTFSILRDFTANEPDRKTRSVAILGGEGNRSRLPRSEDMT